MFLLFIDESGTPPKLPKAKGRYLVIGGVIIPEGAWHGLAKGLTDLKKEYQVTGEIKWKYFGSANDDDRNPLKALSRARRDELRNEIFKLLTGRKAVKLLACVTSVEAAYDMATVVNQDDIYHLTYKGITERFQYFLQDASRDLASMQYGMVISDHRMREDDAKLRKRHHELIERPGDYSSSYMNIIETIHFAPSDASVGLQFADMVAGSVHRAFQYKENRFLTALLPAFRKSKTGEVKGYGIVRMPKGTFIEPSGGGG